MPNKTKTPDPDRGQQAPPMDKYKNPIGAPISREKTPPTKYNPWEFGRNQKIAGKQIRISKLIVKSGFGLSLLGSAIGTITNGGTKRLQSILYPLAPHANELTFGMPYVALYQGTRALSGNQIYPALGGSIGGTAYNVVGGMDYNNFGTFIPGSINSVWSGYIINNSGATGTILFVTQWKHINFNSGSIASTIQIT